MSLTPDTFQRELTQRLGEDHRLRWSSAQQAWCIEQRVGNGVWDLPLSTDPAESDRTTRARDGYALVCTVQPRPFIVCETCHFPIPVPELKIGEVRCAACKVAGRQPISKFVGYFPLCERLLQRLERDSARRSREWRREMDEQNAARAAAKQRAYDNDTEDILREHFNRIANIPQVGAGGIIPSR